MLEVLVKIIKEKATVSNAVSSGRLYADVNTGTITAEGNFTY